MSPQCSRCKRQVSKLVRMDDSETSAAYTELLNVRYEDFDMICVSCALEQLGIDAYDFTEEAPRQDSKQFLLDLMKGNIAQIVVKTILQEFGYDVYPYGYENYLSIVSKSLSASDSNVSARRIRCTPDLFVYHSKSNDALLVEVKTTTTKDESQFFISKTKLDDYAKYWAEAILVIYCLRSGRLYCRRIGNIERQQLKVKAKFGKHMYELNLKNDFQSLPDVFKLLDEVKYPELCLSIKNVLREFGKI